GQRAVTAQDYVAQARLFPGVSKARAEATRWNFIKLYIAPTGSGELPTDVLIRDLLAYFEDRRMLTTFLEIGNPDYVRIDVTAEVTGSPFFSDEAGCGRGAESDSKRDRFGENVFQTDA